MSEAAPSAVDSVVIPVRERVEKLLRCVASVLASEAEGIEVVVVPDRSTADRQALRNRCHA